MQRNALSIRARQSPLLVARRTRAVLELTHEPDTDDRDMAVSPALAACRIGRSITMDCSASQQAVQGGQYLRRVLDCEHAQKGWREHRV